MESPVLLEINQRLSDNLKHISKRFGKPAHTVAHGDYRLKNMVFGTPSAGALLTVVDCQLCEIGRGVAGVAYFMKYGLPKERHRISLKVGLEILLSPPFVLPVRPNRTDGE